MCALLLHAAGGGGGSGGGGGGGDMQCAHPAHLHQLSQSVGLQNPAQLFFDRSPYRFGVHAFGSAGFGGAATALAFAGAGDGTGGGGDATAQKSQPLHLHFSQWLADSLALHHEEHISKSESPS